MEKETAFPDGASIFSGITRPSPQHFSAVFNSSQVAPSGTDGTAAHGSVSGDAEAAALARTAGMLHLGDTLSAHWPGIRGLGSAAFDWGCALPSLN